MGFQERAINDPETYICCSTLLPRASSGTPIVIMNGMELFEGDGEDMHSGVLTSFLPSFFTVFLVFSSLLVAVKYSYTLNLILDHCVFVLWVFMMFGWLVVPWGGCCCSYNYICY